MTTGTSKTSLEAQRQSQVLERATGEWFCQSGMHYTKATETHWRKRRICVPCKQRLIALTKTRITR